MTGKRTLVARPSTTTATHTYTHDCKCTKKHRKCLKIVSSFLVKTNFIVIYYGEASLTSPLYVTRLLFFNFSKIKIKKNEIPTRLSSRFISLYLSTIITSQIPHLPSPPSSRCFLFSYHYHTSPPQKRKTTTSITNFFTSMASHYVLKFLSTTTLYHPFGLIRSSCISSSPQHSHKRKGIGCL